MNRVDVRVDPRIELLSVVQMFTSWKDVVIVKRDYEYKKKYWNGSSPMKIIELLNFVNA
ncbi:hypothetical protein J7L18_02545 [Candidatus Bathyarchaeota archaeon]|nr:hypothetical protein [Candidatus Bathyarchaeota archaeon]